MRFIYNSRFLYCCRIFIALFGVAILAIWLKQPTLTIPLTFGVVSAGSTDLDDRFSGRLVNLLITLLCFFVASMYVELLFPYPWLFLVALIISAFVFIFLGVLGQRYAAIAFGALLLAAYTMLGYGSYPLWYQQPLLLLAGALWYNLVTLGGHLLFPIRPVQDNLARCFQQLGDYLDNKSLLFDPDETNNFKNQTVNLIMVNKQLVTTLEQTRNSLFSRLKSDRGQKGTRTLLSYYFVVQDIHERASSAHVEYQALSAKFCHSDILFRYQRIIGQQAIACRHVAQAILLRKKYHHSPLFERLFQHLDESLSRLEVKDKADLILVSSLENLLQNLRAVDNQLANIDSARPLSIDNDENRLSHDGLTGFKDIVSKIRANLSLNSVLFRHAMRMSIVFLLSYSIIQLTHLPHGYWIILTSLFVCQPNYNATKHRLIFRVIGTLVGILIGIPIIYMVPSAEGQIILIVISGVLFFAFRSVQYAYATGFMTLQVLLCFNLHGDGVSIVLPRIAATLIGCIIAWLAVAYLWPDWKYRALDSIVRRTCNANSHYLAAIEQQYHKGKNNKLDYRIARRETHSLDAELANVVSNISAEPKAQQQLIDLAFRLLSLNHTLLSHISTLGSHRQQIESKQTLAVFEQATRYIIDALHFDKQSQESEESIRTLINTNIEILENQQNRRDLLIFHQLILILALLPEFIQLAENIIGQQKQPA